MTYTDPKYLGEAQEVWKKNGVPVTHAQMIARHVANLKPLHPEDFNGHDCDGEMVFHGHRVAREDGTLIVHWAGGTLFRDVVCVKCGSTWSVETALREMLVSSAKDAIPEEEQPW